MYLGDLIGKTVTHRNGGIQCMVTGVELLPGKSGNYKLLIGDKWINKDDIKNATWTFDDGTRL